MYLNAIHNKLNQACSKLCKGSKSRNYTKQNNVQVYFRMYVCARVNILVFVPLYFGGILLDLSMANNCAGRWEKDNILD